MAGQFHGASTVKLVNDSIVDLGTATTPIRNDPTGSTTQPVSGSLNLIPAVSGGDSVYSFLSTAAVQTAAVKASPGQVYGLHFFNNGAGIGYGRLYNQTGAPASTDTANIVYRFMIPANTSAAGFVVPIPEGLAFATGIGIRISGAIADNDTTVLAANAIVGNVLYK